VTRFLFAAHDPGGALMLAAAAPVIRSRGHEIVFAGAGPTVGLWRDAGYDVAEMAEPVDLTTSIDAVATGTGFSNYEQMFWGWASARQLPSLAVIDAWTNLVGRFQDGDRVVQPNAVCVIDEDASSSIGNSGALDARLFVVGQPHLQAQTALLRGGRLARPVPEGPPIVVFFSEPVREDYGDTRGFDQFQVFRTLAAAIPAGPVDILVKPHPREDAGAWTSAVAECPGAVISGLSAPELLIACDGVAGMTTMVLLEAHLLGLPVLSVQPDRTSVINPIIDEICDVVTAGTALPAAWRLFCDRLGTPGTAGGQFGRILDNADGRLADAMEAVAIGLSR